MIPFRSYSHLKFKIQMLPKFKFQMAITPEWNHILKPGFQFHLKFKIQMLPKFKFQMAITPEWKHILKLGFQFSQ